MNSLSNKVPKRLPRLVFKHELCTYFDECTSRYLWRNILTDDVFEEGGFKKADYAKVKRFPPDVTKHLYRHFDIDDLNARLSDELRDGDEAPKGHRAPSDD